MIHHMLLQFWFPCSYKITPDPEDRQESSIRFALCRCILCFGFTFRFDHFMLLYPLLRIRLPV